MTERAEHDRRSGEGVRIIGPEEAQAAIDAGQASGRRPEDQLRFGDVPPTPQGPRPPHRFPLPDSVDPAAAVPRSPVVQPARSEQVTPVGRGRPVRPEEAHDPRPWQERGAAPAEEPVPGTAGDPVVVDPEPRIVGLVDDGRHTAGAPEAPSLEPEATPAWRAAGLTIDLREDEQTAPPTGAPAPGTVASDPPTWGNEPAASWPLPESARPEVPAGEASAPGRHDDPSAARRAGYAGADVTARSRTAREFGTHRRDERIRQSPAYQGPWTERPSAIPPAEPAAPPAWPSDRVTSSWTPPEPGRASGDVQDLALPEEGINVTGGFTTELPHWTDPPTGEVPRILADAPGGEESDENLAAWEALGARSTRWRDDTTGWDSAEFDDLDDDEVRVGTLDNSRSEHSDIYSFDEDFQRLEEERSGTHRAVDPDWDGYEEEGEEAEPELVAVGVHPGEEAAQPRAARPIRSRPERRPDPGVASRARRGTGGGNPDLGSRMIVGVGLVVVLGLCVALGPVAELLLATAVVTAAAVEVYGMLQHSGFKPATLLGLTATVGVMFAAYWRGPGALPLVAGLVFVASMTWYLIGVVEARPLANVAVTVTAFAWIGLLGSFAALLLRAPHGGGLFLGAILPAVAADIVAYFVGRQMGRRPLAPQISPAKTYEGAIGGAVGAIVVALVVGHSLTPWGGLSHGLLLGLVVAVLAPIGDLFESMVKRDLDVKDSGTALQGHGGVLDRFDSVLLVLPAAYYLASIFGVIH